MPYRGCRCRTSTRPAIAHELERKPVPVCPQHMPPSRVYRKIYKMDPSMHSVCCFGVGLRLFGNMLGLLLDLEDVVLEPFRLESIFCLCLGVFGCVSGPWALLSRYGASLVLPIRTCVGASFPPPSPLPRCDCHQCRVPFARLLCNCG